MTECAPCGHGEAVTHTQTYECCAECAHLDALYVAEEFISRVTAWVGDPDDCDEVLTELRRGLPDGAA